MVNRYKAKATKAYKKWLKRAKKAYGIKSYRASFYLFRRRREVKGAVLGYFRKHATFYWTLIYFSGAALVASLAQLWFADIKPETAFGFYTGAGAMSGGTLAIIFTLNTLLVNFALSQYPPQFFKLSGYDRKQDKIYFMVAALTLGLFVMGFMYRTQSAWQYWLTALGIFSLCAVFYLVFLSYSMTRRRLNPMASLGFITAPAFKLLDDCDKEARQLADRLRKDPTLAEDKKHLADYQPHAMLAPYYEQVNAHIGYLYDYHDKLVEKKDYSAALDVLDAAAGLIIRYVEVRKNSFVLLPSEYLLVPISDAQQFFEVNFQRLVDKAKAYIKIGNQNGSRKVISLMELIGVKLSELSFRQWHNENPPFAQAVGYLGNLCDEAIKQNDLEATFRIARAYAVLGSVAVDKHYMHEQSTVLDGLFKLAIYAWANKQSPVGEQVAKGFTAFAVAYTRRERAAVGNEFRLYLDKLSDFLWYYLALNTPATDFQPNTATTVIEPITIITRWMRLLAKAGSNLQNDQRLKNQRDVIELGERLWRLLRNLTDKKNVSLSNRYMGDQLTERIENACYTLISSAHKNGWQRNSDEALRQASWLLNQVSFFTDNAPDNMENHRLDELSESATNIALYGLHKGSTKLAIDGINVNYQLAITCLNKVTKSADYDAPRIMLNGCLVGLLAFRRGHVEVLRHCKKVAGEFNIAYDKKFFPNGIGMELHGRNYLGAHPKQLFAELRRIANDRFNTDPMYGDSTIETPESYMMKLAPDTEQEHFTALIRYLKHKGRRGGTE